MPARRALLFGGGAFAAVLVATAIALVVALAGLKQLRTGIDLTVLPSWLWYYRDDPRCGAGCYEATASRA
ncbi:hypothetical protein ACFSHP_19035 [Novosphingobium panipatense]